MTRLKPLLLALSLFASFLPLSVLADDEALSNQLAEEFLSYDLGCGATIPHATTTYQRYQQLKRIETYQLNHKPLPFTTGTSSVAGGGLILFTQPPSYGYVLGGGSSVLEVYATPDLKRAALFYMVTSEGPGPLELLLLDQHSSPPTMHCLTLDTPEDLNKGGWKMEYSLPVNFNINDLGKGMIYTRADIEDTMGQTQTLWFVYYTQDNGNTWSKPERLMQAPPSTIAGLYQKAQNH